MKNFEKFPENVEFFEIKGGNHSQFGYFGTLLGDGETLLTKKQQQEIVFDKINEFINKIQGKIE